ncbi:MAG: UDP-glucose 4-epimerase [Actinomycetota bacterium]|jgi:dTDP-glucose 4,6-dehydratase/UDP-glucose 4-epimerase|nr:UDP-glucose 4-epimerase [Actinomycetota bacterium]
MSTVLVTGATGFVGSHLLRDLVRRGHTVHALVRPDRDPARLADLAGAYTPVIADLRDAAAVGTLVRALAPSRVFHLAAATMHAGRSPGSADLVTTNLGGTVALLDACRDLDLDAFVNVGDAFEYGPGAGPIAESAVCRPTSLDGITKLAASQYGAALAASCGLPVVNVRPFSIVGRHDDPRRLVPRLVSTAREGTPVALSDPRIPRDFVAVADVVDLLGRAAEHATRLPGRVFNCGSGATTTLGELVTAVECVTGAPIRAEWGAFPVAEHDLAHPVADPTAAADELGWRAVTSLDEMILDLWDGA